MFKLISRISKLFLITILFLSPLISLSQDTTNFLSKYRSTKDFNWLEQRKSYYMDSGLPVDSLAEQYNIGIENIQNEKYKEAISCFKTSYGIEKNNIDSWKSETSYLPDYLIGICFSMLKESDSAIYYLNKSLKNKLDIESHYVAIAKVYAEDNEYKKGLNYCDSALKVNSYSVDALYVKSYIYYKTGKLNVAEKEIKKAQKRNPENITLNMLIAEIYSIRNKRLKAIGSYKKVISADSTLMYAYQQIGYNYFLSNKDHNAIEYMQKATSLDTTNSYNYFFLGLMYYKNHISKTKSFEYLIKSINIQKQDSIKYYGQSFSTVELKEIIYELVENTNLTKDEKKVGSLLLDLYIGNIYNNPYTKIKRFSEKYPTSLFINRVYNLLLYNYYGKWMSSTYFEKIMEIDSTIVTVILIDAECCFARKDYQEALEKTNYVTAQIPVFLSALNLKANTYLELEKYDETLLLLDSIENLAPGRHLTLYYKSIAYEGKKNYRQALDFLFQFQDAVSDINNSIAEYKISNCYYNLGLIDSALYFAELSIENRKNIYWDEYLLLGKIYLEKNELRLAEQNITKAVNMTHLQVAKPYYYKAILYLKRGYKHKAIESLERAILIDSSYAEAYYKIAEIYYELEKFDKVIEFCEMAVLKKTNYFEAMYMIPLAELRLGNIEEAEYQYIRYAEINMEFENTIAPKAISDLQYLIDHNIYPDQAKSIIDKLNELQILLP